MIARHKGRHQLKVVHFVAGDLSGGAARGAHWLHIAQRKIGIDSKILTDGYQSGDDESIISLIKTPTQRFKHRLWSWFGNSPVYLYRQRKPWIFNTGFAGLDVTRHSAYQEADLIHLHWINGLVNMRTLKKFTKPIVWTIRDMWPLTGGCHYSMGCDRYEIGCGKCPQLGSQFQYDLTRIVLQAKRQSLPKKTVVVGISRWLSECAKESRAFEGFQVETIMNNVDTSKFEPVDKNVAREVLGLPRDKKIILAGSHSIHDFYKGFDLLVGALRVLGRDDYHLVKFGKDSGIAFNSTRCTNLGFLSDAIALRLAYSAADVFVGPSRIDAFGKTLAEAMACGTPVVCFDATGPKEVVEHKVTGFKAVAFEPASLAEGINWVLNQSDVGTRLISQSSRERVLRLFDSIVIAREYEALYERMLG